LFSIDKLYTVIVVPERHAEPKRFTFRTKWLYQFASLVLVLGLIAGAMSVHYFLVLAEARETPALREQNVKLKNDLVAIQEQMAHVQSTLDRVDRFDQKLRGMTQLSDPQRNLAMGPVAAPSNGGVVQDNQFVKSPHNDSAQTILQKLDKVSAEATRQEQSLTELQAYFQDQKSLLASVPSVWPVNGWVTSDFGSRLDPYTSERVMHAGIDIAGPHGKEIISPSEGTVVFAGLEGGYGNVLVIDHGYGVKTRYGHLASMVVKPGDRVKRGQPVGTLGNTGRSTGPHLHYEVRVNGIAQNPHKFVVDDY
jgi:murein DD-endopeptidase MepM/ murein hydrolase activator NlpD